MVFALLRYAFFLALVVSNVLFFLEADGGQEANSHLASRQLVQCWGANGGTCSATAVVAQQRPQAEQPLLKFTSLRGKNAFGFGDEKNKTRSLR